MKPIAICYSTKPKGKPAHLVMVQTLTEHGSMAHAVAGTRAATDAQGRNAYFDELTPEERATELQDLYDKYQDMDDGGWGADRVFSIAYEGTTKQQVDDWVAALQRGEHPKV